MWYRIKSNTETKLIIERGNLATYLPPLSSWWLQQLKQQLKRDPTEEELREEAQTRKSKFLVCDGEPRGTRNGHFAWSSQNQNFDAEQTDDDIIDEVHRWAICLRLRDNPLSEFCDDTATVDVTPRRCQEFHPRPGENVHWENLDCANPDSPRKIAEGEIEADEHGLVTVPGLTVGREGWGNRLVVTRNGKRPSRE